MKNTISNIGMAWIDAIFEAKQAKTGGIVRRSVRSVQKFASEQVLLDEIKARGFHLVRTEKQYLIFCNSGTMRLLV